MIYHLNIDWTTAAHEDVPPLLENLSVQLISAETKQILNPVIEGRRLHFSAVKVGFYQLLVQYHLQGRVFDSFAFGLDIPDITLMKLQLLSSGQSLIEQMGALNDYGEFIDTRLSDEPLYLTRPLDLYPVHAALVPLLQEPFLYNASSDPEVHFQSLQQAFGDLSVSFPQVQALWAYQLRHLLHPAFLARCTAAALACFQHLLVNHLALMDDEILLERILVAIEQQGVADAVDALSELLSWNPMLQVWDGMDLFLKAISGVQVLKP